MPSYSDLRFERFGGRLNLEAAWPPSEGIFLRPIERFIAFSVTCRPPQLRIAKGWLTLTCKLQHVWDGGISSNDSMYHLKCCTNQRVPAIEGSHTHALHLSHRVAVKLDSGRQRWRFIAVHALPHRPLSWRKGLDTKFSAVSRPHENAGYCRCDVVLHTSFVTEELKKSDRKGGLFSMETPGMEQSTPSKL